MAEVVIDERGVELLAKTTQLFMRFGIKSMTMDDIARQLGVSKKTLYLYVSDKNDLVVKVMESIVAHEKQLADDLSNRFPNAIDMLFELSRSISQKFGQIHPSINYDLEKYHPEAWKLFKDFQVDFVAGCIEDNIRRGVEQGLYRDNINAFIIAHLYTRKMDMCTDPDVFPSSDYNFKDIHLEMMRYHIRGIASDKGLKYLMEKVKHENYQL